MIVAKILTNRSSFSPSFLPLLYPFIDNHRDYGASFMFRILLACRQINLSVRLSHPFRGQCSSRPAVRRSEAWTLNKYDLPAARPGLSLPKQPNTASLKDAKM